MDRIVLGIYDGPSGGAALLHEGRLLAIAEEDRLLRKSGVAGLPRASVQTVLKESGVPSEEIDAVMVATLNSPYSEGVGSTARPPLLYRVGTALPAPPHVGRRIRESFASSRRRRVDEALRSEFGISCPVLFVDHHLAHAVASAYVSGHPDCLAITMDGGGDGAWAAVTTFTDGEPTRLLTESGSTSLLSFLDAVCDRLGITEGTDRHLRLQQLATPGVTLHREQFAPCVRWNDGRILVDRSLFKSRGPIDRVPVSARREDVAASALTLAAEAVQRFVTHWYVRSDQETLVLGGDLFEIPAMVGAVLESPEVPRALVPPGPGDEGLMVGSAYAGCLLGFLPEPLEAPREPLPTPFLGVAFGDEEIEEILLREGIDAELVPDVERTVAGILADGGTVARFDGKAEIGNRGLGNRAILRSPELPLRRGRLGFSLAPTAYHALVLEESFPECFRTDGIREHDFSQFPGPVTPLPVFARRCPELVGWGGKVETQTVSRRSNPRLFRILREFSSRTGCPCLATAPFRLPGEPLVSSPHDALMSFRLLGPDYLAVGRYLVPAPDVDRTRSRSAPEKRVGSRIDP